MQGEARWVKEGRPIAEALTNTRCHFSVVKVL